MDVRHGSSITGVGSPAANRVASSLSPRSVATGKTGAPKPMATGSSSGNGAAADSSDPSDITSSDFLTLLVSELQNQDPTQPADPNAYITQLVQVNSLQQLIQINQTSQLAGGDTVALLNDIDSTVDPNSTVATPPSSGSGSGSNPNSNAVSGSPSNKDSAANVEALARSKEAANANSAFDLHSRSAKGSLWGGTGSS